MRAPTIAEVRSPDDRPMPGPVSARPRTVRRAIVAAAVGLLLFLLIQGLLAAYNADVSQEAFDRGWLYPSFDRMTLGARLSTALLYGALAYVVVSLAGAAIAGQGHRLLFIFPGIALIFVPVLLTTHQPEAIGLEWAVECYGPFACTWPWFAHPWIGAFVDLILILIPAAVVARSVRPRGWPGRTDAPTVAAILTTAATAGTAWWALAAIDPYVDPATLGTVAIFGLVLGVSRPWWPWLHVVFAAFAFGLLGLVLDLLVWADRDFSLGDVLPYALEELWPIVAVGLIASAWQPLAWAIRKLQERSIRLVIAVNVLNVADALMTFLAVRSGGAIEANPVVRIAGLPAKVVLVGLLTWLLYRRKPSALVWPFAALLWVAGYHVAGILVNG